MAKIFWMNLYCSTCGKNTKHCHTIKGTGEHQDSSIKGDVEPLLNAFNISPDADWECWACKTKGRKSIRKYEEDGAYITFFIDKNKTQEDVNKNPDRTAIESLAQVISYLEDRLASLEKTLALKKRKRGIKIKYRE